jgi:hypothetical protein
MSENQRPELPIEAVRPELPGDEQMQSSQHGAGIAAQRDVINPELRRPMLDTSQEAPLLRGVAKLRGNKNA